MIPCEICRHYQREHPTPAATHQSPGIGLICKDCRPHTQAAYLALTHTPGISRHPLPDHAKRNHHRKRRKRAAGDIRFPT